MYTTAKNLTQEAPRSPRTRLGSYALMARMIDKGRASLEGNVGEYHYACPLDAMLFDFKGVNADEVKKLLGSGATDEQVVSWFNGHGTPKTTEEIQGWSAGVEGWRPYDVPRKGNGSSANVPKSASSPKRPPSSIISRRMTRSASRNKPPRSRTVSSRSCLTTFDSPFQGETSKVSIRLSRYFTVPASKPGQVAEWFKALDSKSQNNLFQCLASAFRTLQVAAFK